MARSKRSKAAKKRFANQKKALQEPMLPPEPSQPLPLQLPVRQPSQPLPLQSLVQQPSQLAIEQLREFQENNSYTFTATHSPHLVQPVDTLQANTLTLTPNDVDILIQSLPKSNAWKDNLEEFSAFEKFERGAMLKNAENVGFS